jgi:hypothetical protein
MTSLKVGQFQNGLNDGDTNEGTNEESEVDDGHTSSSGGGECRNQRLKAGGRRDNRFLDATAPGVDLTCLIGMPKCVPIARDGLLTCTGLQP